MRIAELTAYHVRIPLLKTIRHASHSRKENDTFLVCCRLDDGTEGWGEGLPRAYVTGETIETVFTHFVHSDLTGQLGGPITDLPSAVALCESLQLASLNGRAHRDCFGNAARCAIELSLLDAVARRQGVPLSTVTDLLPETLPIRRKCDEVRYSGAITAMNPLKELTRAFLLRYFGFRQSKVKVGVKGVNDAASLARIRWVVGKQFDLRIDANEAWSCSNLEAKLQPLVRYNISSLEQPVPHGEVDRLSKIRPRIAVPIMLDESLCSLSDAHRAIERRTCDLFNIRISKCGGFLNSLKLAAIAHQSELGYQLGCQVGETGILSAAGRHFACSLDGIRYLEGSYDRFLVGEPLTVEDVSFHHGGRAPTLTGPGLGVEIDRIAVKRVTVKEEHRKFT